MSRNEVQDGLIDAHGSRQHTAKVQGCDPTVLRVVAWCRSRSSVYYERVPTPEREYRLVEAIDRTHTDKPFLGSRRIVDELVELELLANRKCVQRLMRLMGIEAMYPRPRTSRPGAGAGHRVFPYRLAGVEISRPNQLWAADVTFIPMRAGFAYLVAIMDVYSRKVLAWRLSNTQSARFSSWCIVTRSVGTRGASSRRRRLAGWRGSTATDCTASSGTGHPSRSRWSTCRGKTR